MSKNNSILSFIKAGLSKIEFLDNCTKANIQYQDDEDSSIFSNESTIEQVFDIIDINKDGKLDESEINKFAALDETDGENILSEVDLKKVYENMSAKLDENIKLAEPETMYDENIKTGKMDINSYLQLLGSQIELLENLISLREQNSKNIINDLQSQIDSLIKNKKGAFQKEYQKQLKTRDNLQAEIQKIDNQLKSQNSNNKYNEEIELINAEISDLNPNTDADKIDAKNKEIAQIRQKAQKNDNSIKQLQNKRDLYQTQLTDINTQISIRCDKITENDTNLKSKVKELNNKIEQEQKSLKQDIENYKSQIETLQAAQNYAIEQIIQDNAANHIPEDYEDEDTSNFSYDAAQLKQTWAKKAPNLSDGFYAKATAVAQRLGCDPNVLLAIMDSESGIKSTAVNKHSGATGLIQFMPKTARSLGTSTEALKQMSPEQQLVYVEKYLQNAKKNAGFSNSDKLDAGTMYTLVFLPAYAKREVLAIKGHKYYNSNADLDANGDGRITKRELGARVRNRIPKG